jgi:CRISPR-associated protein Cas2
MLILITYDIANTDTRAGRRRLRRMAKICLNYGERVQYSVFECTVDAATYELLEAKLLEEMDEKVDNLRIYRLVEPLKKHIKEFGKFKATNFEDPLII